MTATASSNVVCAMSAISRSEVEDFLFFEADLLDDWELLRWAQLFTDDGVYLIPPFSDPNADPSKTLFLVYDDRHRLTERAKRLLDRMGHAEFPHSRTRRLISNVRILQRHDDGLTVSCNFLVHRAKGSITDVYPGHSRYRLIRNGDSWKIKSKRAALDLTELRPQGKVSIIL